MFMNINLAVGGIWATVPDKTTPFPAHMDIDYVRVYQRPAYEAPSKTPEPNIATRDPRKNTDG
jgi:beta-glucanase (GH16 family)